MKEGIELPHLYLLQPCTYVRAPRLKQIIGHMVVKRMRRGTFWSLKILHRCRSFRFLHADNFFIYFDIGSFTYLPPITATTSLGTKKIFRWRDKS